MTIIIGYDGSDGAKGAITFAGQYFSGRDANVVTAFEDWPPAVHGNAVQIDDAARAKTEATAEEGAALARQVGIKAEPRTVYAAKKAWRSIIDVADELDAGLIVVGSHGFNGLRPLVLGSVSHQLAHHAHQPVIAVPTPQAVAARRELKKDSVEETTAAGAKAMS
jgi:nucleotide-binding universal stress UspA family protein